MPTTEPDHHDPIGTGETAASVAGRHVGLDVTLRGDVQSEIFRSKVLMSRARELLDALMALARQPRN